MANQELKIDGTTIIKLVGSGKLHDITSTVQSSFSVSSLTYMVKNGICFCWINNLHRSSVGSALTITTALPKTKYAWVAHYCKNTLIYIDGGTTLTANYSPANDSIMDIFIYPVADDWVEPSV